MIKISQYTNWTKHKKQNWRRKTLEYHLDRFWYGFTWFLLLALWLWISSGQGFTITLYTLWNSVLWSAADREHVVYELSGSLCIPGTSYMRLNKKKEEPSRSSSLLLDGSQEFDLTNEKIWIAIQKIFLIRRCFQTVSFCT